MSDALDKLELLGLLRPGGREEGGVLEAVDYAEASVVLEKAWADAVARARRQIEAEMTGN